MRFEGVSKSFGRHQVLAGIDLEISGGEKVALMGANGAGKTTLLRLAAGLLRPTSGRVQADGVFVPQDAPVYPELTVAEHMAFWCRLHGVPKATSSLPAPHRPAGDLSRGQRQRLHLEMAFATGKSLLLDEPFTGLDDAAASWLETTITAYPAAVLMALHDPLRAKRLAGRVLHISEGRL